MGKQSGAFSRGDEFRFSPRRGFLAFVLSLMLLLRTAATAQTQAPQNSSGCPIEGPGPSDVVEQIWLWATQGELLTEKGWSQAGYYFSQPGTFEGKHFQIVSNRWGPAGEQSTEDGRILVHVGFSDYGTIDSALRFVPRLRTDVQQLGALYHLVPAPKYDFMYSSDGKTLLDKRKRLTGKCMWQIEGKQGIPWTTVNTAIRYVLDARDKARSETLKKNADRTLSALRLLH